MVAEKFNVSWTLNMKSFSFFAATKIVKTQIKWFYELLLFSDVLNDLVSKNIFWYFECLCKVFGTLIKLLKIDGLPEFDLQFFSLVR